MWSDDIAWKENIRLVNDISECFIPTDTAHESNTLNWEIPAHAQAQKAYLKWKFRIHADTNLMLIIGKSKEGKQ